MSLSRAIAYEGDACAIASLSMARPQEPNASGSITRQRELHVKVCNGWKADIRTIRLWLAKALIGTHIVRPRIIVGSAP